MARMELPPVLKTIVDWLRAGYPEGVPDVDYLPLFALLGSELTNHDVNLIAEELELSSDPQSAETIKKAIAPLSPDTFTTRGLGEERSSGSSAWITRQAPNRFTSSASATGDRSVVPAIAY